jgi:hypothetical protein
MLYAVIMRFDSLREIETSMAVEVRKLHHVGSLFSNAIFKGVGRHPKTGKKKGGIKVHSVTHANKGVPCDVQFTSAAMNDSFAS